MGLSNLSQQFTTKKTHIAAQNFVMILRHLDQMVLAVPYCMTATLQFSIPGCYATCRLKARGLPISYQRLQKFRAPSGLTLAGMTFCFTQEPLADAVIKLFADAAKTADRSNGTVVCNRNSVAPRTIAKAGVVVRRIAGCRYWSCPSLASHEGNR